MQPSSLVYHLVPEHFHHPQKRACPHKQSLPICPSPSSWQPLVYFLSLQICWFWAIPVDGIVHSVAFCVWLLSISMMSSKFIHMVACISVFSFDGWVIFYCTPHLVLAQSCPTLCNPVDCSPPGSSSVHRIFQAKIKEWVAIFFSRESSWSRNWTQVSYIAGRSLPSEPPGNPSWRWLHSIKHYLHTHTHTHTEQMSDPYLGYPDAI